MNEVYLCLGGNLGNCIENLHAACVLIEKHAGQVVQRSSIYQSQAWGMRQAPDFFNRVVKINTLLSAEALWQVLLDIEKTLGRERTTLDGYQNRLIDIDILFFNQDHLDTADLQIPHPRLHLRKFVLEPLQEIDPDLVHPVLHKTITQLLAACTDNGEIKKLSHAV